MIITQSYRSIVVVYRASDRDPEEKRGADTKIMTKKKKSQQTGKNRLRASIDHQGRRTIYEYLTGGKRKRNSRFSSVSFDYLFTTRFRGNAEAIDLHALLMSVSLCTKIDKRHYPGEGWSHVLSYEKLRKKKLKPDTWDSPISHRLLQWYGLQHTRSGCLVAV